MNDTNNGHYAHPAFWGPFVVVGEGGEGEVGLAAPQGAAASSFLKSFIAGFDDPTGDL